MSNFELHISRQLHELPVPILYLPYRTYGTGYHITYGKLLMNGQLHKPLMDRLHVPRVPHE